MRYTKKQLKALKAEIKSLYLNQDLTAAEISVITSVTPKTVGLWLKEVKAEQLRDLEHNALQERQSTLNLLLHLKAAKYDFIQKVDAAINEYLNLNT